MPTYFPDFLCLILLSFFLFGLSEDVKIPKLILISMDGMRYNFLDKVANIDKKSNFTYFMENGVKARFVRNIFPSVTFPNHMTIATGLYPESHGMVDNDFWDPYLLDVFHMGKYLQNFESKWFDVGAEPIWVTNHKAGRPRDSGVIMWPGGVAEMKSFMPRVTPGVNWNNSTYTWSARVDHMVSWFLNTENNTRPINLGILYFEEPDEVAHKYGPDNGNMLTEEVQNKIYELDVALGHLRKRLVESNLLDEMNIIITADHGHTNVGTYKKINLDTFLDRKLYTTQGVGLGSLVTKIDAAPGISSDDLYNKLKKIPNINVYRKGESALKELHLNDNRRIRKFILEAKDGYMMGNNDTLPNIKLLGTHGYDPKKVHNMRPFFIGFGPAFKKGFVAEAFDSVDIYPLMCRILGIEPAPNNGTLENVQQLLTGPPPKKKLGFEFTAVTFLIVVIFVASVGGVYAIGAFKQNRILKRTYNKRTVGNSRTSSLLNSVDDDEDEEEF